MSMYVMMLAYVLTQHLRIAGGAERSNAEAEEVIAYEPPAPGEELCEICGGGEDEGMLRHEHLRSI